MTSEEIGRAADAVLSGSTDAEVEAWIAANPGPVADELRAFLDEGSEVTRQMQAARLARRPE